jgi:2-polyprenyl-3-methyl-5-hydroxy-6-metoxy-1,4-benzoquinol methylase
MRILNIIEKQPIKLTDSIEEEYNPLIRKINQKEEEAIKRGITIPGPEILNREGGDATLANNPYLAAVHFSNYLAVKKIIESFIPDKSALAKIHILGIGEGSGVFAYFLSSALKLKSYLATDYQNLLVDYGQKVLGGSPLEFRRVDATTMDSIQNHSFDVIIACEFVEHLTSEKLANFILKGLLKFFPQGISGLYKINTFIKGGEKRQELSFPKEYSQTKLVYKPKDETKAFGLCLVLQT